MVDVEGKEAKGLRSSAAAVVAKHLTTEQQVKSNTEQSMWTRQIGLPIVKEILMLHSTGRGPWASSYSCPGGEGLDNLEERKWGTNSSSLQPLLLHAQSLMPQTSQMLLPHLACLKPLSWLLSSFVCRLWLYCVNELTWNVCCVVWQNKWFYDEWSPTSFDTWGVKETIFFIDLCDEALHSKCTIFFWLCALGWVVLAEGLGPMVARDWLKGL